MATTPSVLKHVTPLNRTRVERWETVEGTAERFGEESAREVIEVCCRPQRKLQCLCPVCRERCAKDGLRHEAEGTWRAPDPDGASVIMLYRPQGNNPQA